VIADLCIAQPSDGDRVLTRSSGRDSSGNGRRTVPFKVDATGRSTRIPASRRVRRDIRPPEGEPWVWLTRELLSSAAWQAMRINERRILDRLMLEHMAHGGVENGKLRVSHRQFIKYGVTKNEVATSIRGLQQRGLICVTVAEPDGNDPRLLHVPADVPASGLSKANERMANLFGVTMGDSPPRYKRCPHF
jgi:hypothetical protein